MTVANDLSLITYVIQIAPHNNVCERSVLSSDGLYYYAIEREHDNDVLVLYGNSVPFTTDLALAKIFESGARARRFGKSIEGRETIRTTVHPVSSKIFFEASLKGLR